METKQIVEKLIEFRNIHQAAIDTASKLIEEVLPWTPREYTWKETSPESNEAEGFKVGPLETLQIAFGVEHIVPGSLDVPGIPETVEKRFGVEHAFRLKHLLVDASIAESFSIQHLFVGNRVAWRAGSSIPATRFVEPIDLKVEAAPAGIQICLTVVNNTEEWQWFRAKIVGEELILPWQKTAAA